MRANLFGELDRRLAHMVDDVLIRDFVRMWHGVNVASRGPQWIRHIVVDPIGDIIDAFRCDKIEVFIDSERAGEIQPVTG